MNVFELYASLGLDTDAYYAALNEARRAAEVAGTAIQDTLQRATGDNIPAPEIPAPDTSDYDRGLREAEQESENFTDRLNDLFKKLGIGAALAAAGKAAVDFSKQVVSAYSTFEQMEGGIDTIFGAGGDTLEQYAERVGKSVDKAEEEYNRLIDAQELVKDNAKNAFASAGISANEYMNTITGFSSALIQSLGGDTKAAAEVADRALRDMSDNVNKFGNDMGTVSATYQSLARGSYMMLDSLKLGYGGTKAEMERLIADTAKMTDIQDKLNVKVKEGDLSFGNIVNAISVLQDKLNIAGATAQEAAGTIEGSLNAMKAAWENLVTDLGSSTADIEQDVEHLTEYLGYAIDNITPVVENMVAQLPTALEGVVEAAGDIIPTLAQTIIENAPNLLDSAFTMVETLAQGIADNLPVLVPSAVDAVLKVGETLLDNIDTIIDVAGKLIEGLAKGLIEAIPVLIERIPEIIESIATGLYNGVTTLIETAQNMVTEIITVLADYDRWEQVGAGWYNALIRGLNGDYDAEHAAAMAKFEGKTVEELNQMRVNLQRQADGIKTAHDEAVESIKKYGTLNPDDISDMFIRNQFKEWRKTHQSEGWDVFFATELDDFNNQISDINEAMGQASNGVYNAAVESGKTIDAAGEIVTAHVNDYGKNQAEAYAAMFEGGRESVEELIKKYADNLDHLLATHKITQEEYDKQLSDYLNTHVDTNSELWWKYYDGIAKRAQQAQEQSTKSITKSQKTAVKKISETTTETTKDLSSVFDVMSSSVGIALSDTITNLGNIIKYVWKDLSDGYKKAAEEHVKEVETAAKTYTNTLQSIWDGYVGQLDLWKKVDISDTVTAWQIGDIDRQTKGLQRYEDTYKAVLGRMGDEIDDTEKNLLKKISGMNLDQKTSYTDYLASMTESEFNAYMQSYKKYVEQSEELAVIEGNSISDATTEIVQSVLNDVDYEGIGKTGAEQYMAGFYTELVNGFAVDANEAVSKSFYNIFGENAHAFFEKDSDALIHTFFGANADALTGTHTFFGKDTDALINAFFGENADAFTVNTHAAEVTKTTVPVATTQAQAAPENITVNINGIQFKTVEELSQSLIQAITNATNRRKAGYAV